jgi:O-antigen/teichoic acid export membrane protein
MKLAVQTFKNVGSNWFGTVLTVLVGVFLSPFILHMLGDDAFGLWILILSITGYYGIFDFGIRSSIVKYVAEFEATGDRDGLTRVVNVSIFVYSCVALALLVVTSIGSLYLNVLFRISPSFLHTARLLFLMVGSSIALGLPMSVFAGILEGLQKFYFVNVIQAVATLLRVLLIIFALDHGLGLLTVAFITVLIPLLSYVVYAWQVMHTIPLKFGERFVDKSTCKLMFRYSIFSFISIVAFRLRFQTDAIIIGAMLSASAITYFSIGSKLISYSSLFVAGVAQILTPMFSQLHATNDQRRLRKLFVLGNRACGLVALPISATLLVLGKSVIDVWVGPRYESSYLILVILLIPSILSDLQGGSRQMLYGMGRHQALAIVNVVEGLINVVMSTVLIHYWGIVGDALGTAIPLTITSVLFLPPYLCRLLKIPLWKFLGETYLLPLALCAPMVGTLLFMQHLYHARTYLQLVAQVAAGCFVYGVGLILLFFTSEPMGQEVQTKFRQYVLQAVGR